MPANESPVEREAYNISFKIRHPSWLARRFTEILDCEPEYAWDVGEEHRTTSGKLLRVRKHTYWCVSYTVEGDRNFVQDFKQICAWLSTKKLFLEELQASGGRISIDIGLRGSTNIGWEFEAADLRLAADLGISLGIEVFPDMNVDEEIRDEEFPWKRRS
jgi:hypothetical protein